RHAPLDELARAYPDRAFALPCDVTVPSQRDELLERAAQALGGLDGLVCAAGVVVHEPPGSISVSSLNAQLETNLVAPLRLGEQALERLESGGAVVCIASTLALRPLES